MLSRFAPNYLLIITRIKNGYKLWADSALQGMKRRLRESGRLL